jgi:ergothioneine biosynthesis protein EgtB
MSAASQPEARTDGGAWLARQYTDVRAYTLALTKALSAEDCQIQSMPDASPVKWHLAHTTWFFETLVLAGKPGYRPFDPDFAYLFNSYYEALGPRHARPRRGLITRPSLQDVLAYRAHVDAAMTTVLDDPAWADTIMLGLHHEQQHQELIVTDMKHALFANPMLPAWHKSAPPPTQSTPLQWHSHPGGIVEIGHDGNGFAYDNESPRHQVLLRPFRIAARPVTNGEYRAFIADGGYQRAQLWLSDGWALAQAEGWTAPLYWLNDEGERPRVSTTAGVQALDDNAPVQHVSLFEAAAFAVWAGKRLATEFEWEAACNAFTYGQVWEWTCSAYAPYPGFRPFAGAAAEYNGKFMVNQMVLRGGSHATPPGHMRPTYRNFFPAGARWQFTGIRLAEDAS